MRGSEDSEGSGTLRLVSELSATEALKIWKKAGTIDAALEKKLKAALKKHTDHDHAHRIVTIFATVGAVLAGLGTMLFVASNWSAMGPLMRSSILFGWYAVVCGGAVVTGDRSMSRVSASLWFLATLVLGANIFLLGQIYHFSLTFWQGPILWMIGALAMGTVMRQSIYGYLSVLLGILGLGWMSGGIGWGIERQMEFLFSDGGLRPLLPVFGLGMIAGAALLRKKHAWQFMDAGLMFIGTLLFTVLLIATTAHSDVAVEFFTADFSRYQMIVLALILVVIAGAIGFASFRSERSRLLLLCLTAGVASLLIPYGDASWTTVFAENGFVHFVYVLLLFFLSLGAVSWGLRERDERFVNVGMLATAAIIFLQYFSWSFELLDRSIAFILGGLLLIVLATVLEKKRRSILKQIA